MPVTEESRHRLHQKLDEAIGPEEATTSMEHLPPVGWADVATTQHLTQVEERLDAKIDHGFALVAARFEVVDEQFKAVHADIAGLRALVLELGKKIDASDRRIEAQTTTFDQRLEAQNTKFDRRFEAQNTKFEHQFWQFLGLVVAVAALALTLAKLFGG